MAMQDINSLFLGLQKLAMSFTTADANQDGVISQDEVNIWATNALQSASSEEASPYDSFRSVLSDGSRNEHGVTNFNNLAKGDGAVSSPDIEAFIQNNSSQIQAGQVIGPESLQQQVMTWTQQGGHEQEIQQAQQQLQQFIITPGHIDGQTDPTVPVAPEGSGAPDTTQYESILERYYQKQHGRPITSDEKANWLEKLNNGTATLTDVKRALKAETAPKTE